MKKLLALAFVLASTSVSAKWTADQTDSQINFLSTKKEHIVEIHKFDRFSAEISKQGQAELTIDLTSVNTMIPIRNERMQKYLFETTEFAAAKLTATISPELVSGLAVGTSINHDLNAEFSLHGESKPLKVKTSITALTDGKFLVQSRTPVLIDSRQYALTAGVDKLRELAKLPSIGYVVPVTFSLVFSAE